MDKGFLLKEHNRLERVLQNAWLNVGAATEENLPNPLEKKTEFERENPHIHILRVMRNPDYFPFTCKAILNIEILPFQSISLKELWTRKYPMLIETRGGGKTFILGVYSILRALLNQGSKVVLVGGAFRQSKLIFEVCEAIWMNAPVLRSMVDETDRTQKPRHDVDRCLMKIGKSSITAIPIGDGSKIRGLRATHLVTDEFDSVPEEIYETVISGFAAVSANPVQKVKEAARIRKLRELGKSHAAAIAEMAPTDFGNQAVISGTASYAFRHFAKYWRRYKAIIETKGDTDKLEEVFGGEIPSKFNWKDYSIIRLPYDLLPESFMDESHIARSKATVHSGTFNAEFGACFVTDSNGFFKRSLIESCVCSEKNPIVIHAEPIKFSASIRGQKNYRYVYGVDPASESDNFSLVVVEMRETHRRIVHVWSTNRATHRDRIKQGQVNELDYYGYCCRKIRNLMKTYPCARIALDSQGGGVAVAESLHDLKMLEPGEKPIWPIPDKDGKDQDSDRYMGEHILEMIHFSGADWVREANHGMRKDFEDKSLLFPYYDPLEEEFALHEDKKMGRTNDTLAECVAEIELLKDELTSIVMTQVGVTGRDRWDVPDVKLPGGKKGKQRKDRYSALLMANAVARVLQAPIIPMRSEEPVGGFANVIVTRKRDDAYGQMYNNAPDWMKQYTANAENFGRVIKR